MNKRLIILGGVSGSGKSELAYCLVAGLTLQHSTGHIVCSADDYPGYYVTGDYVWSSEVCKAAHKYCQNKAKTMCESNFELIIIDNTNLTSKARQFYVELARRHDYELQIISIEPLAPSLQKYAERNKHGVDVGKIRQMAKAYWDDRAAVANAFRG